MQFGQPNTLSDEAAPNRLSIQADGPGPLGVSQPLRPAAPQPVANRSWDTTGTAPVTRAPTRLRIPSLGSIIFIAFAIFTAFRLISSFVSSNEQPGPTTPGIAISTPASVGEIPSVRGTIAFGTGEDGGCGVIGQAESFGVGTGVWWTAFLSSEQAGTGRVQLLVKRDGRQVDQSIGPGDDSTEPWDVLCASEPITQPDLGTYRVEVRSYDGLTLLASGTFARR